MGRGIEGEYGGYRKQVRLVSFLNSYIVSLYFCQGKSLVFSSGNGNPCLLSSTLPLSLPQWVTQPVKYLALGTRRRGFQIQALPLESSVTLGNLFFFSDFQSPGTPFSQMKSDAFYYVGKIKYRYKTQWRLCRVGRVPINLICTSTVHLMKVRLSMRTGF